MRKQVYKDYMGRATTKRIATALVTLPQLSFLYSVRILLGLLTEVDAVLWYVYVGRSMHGARHRLLAIFPM